MNFDHWKEAEAIANGAPNNHPAAPRGAAVSEARRANVRRSAKPPRPIPIDRAYTKFPVGRRAMPKPRGKAVKFVVTTSAAEPTPGPSQEGSGFSRPVESPAVASANTLTHSPPPGLGVGSSVSEVRPSLVNNHFIASDHGPDMELTLAERVEGVTETV